MDYVFQKMNYVFQTNVPSLQTSNFINRTSKNRQSETKISGLKIIRNGEKITYHFMAVFCPHIVPFFR